MKKVLLVVPSLAQGGGEKFVVDLAKNIDRTKFEVKLLVFYKQKGTILEKDVQESKIDVTYLDKKVGFDFNFFKPVKKFIKEYKPDVIHSNLDTMLYLIPSYKRRQVKLHTVHTIAQKEGRGLQRLIRVLAYKVFGVVPVGISKIIAKSVVDEYHIGEQRVPVVYNGVKCSRYNLMLEKDDKLNLVSVGSLYPVKNFGFMIDCFAEICEKNENVYLTILGEGESRKELEAQIKEKGLQEKVRLAGLVRDVENYLAAADIYVASSVYEGLPLSILEAMAAGLPIISTDVGGIREIVNNGENGILVPLGDKTAYINALEALIADEQKRGSYAKQSKILSQKFDVKQMVEGYEKLYQTK